MTAYTVHKIANTVKTQYFTEPLEGLGDALALDMVLVPAGKFIMGSPAEEPERDVREGPQHEVNLYHFFMGRYPITQSQWRAVATLEKVDIDIDVDPSNFEGSNRPVEQVSYHEAVEFCLRLFRYTKRPYRLPSEAEWEYACRAGTTTPFAFGKTLTTEVANYNGKFIYNSGPKGQYRGETNPVDELQVANAFGLCDMHGNVWEWCADHRHSSYEGAPTDGSVWVSESREKGHVLRGGAWGDLPWFCRSASRDFKLPDDRSYGIGFRVCCAAPRNL